MKLPMRVGAAVLFALLATTTAPGQDKPPLGERLRQGARTLRRNAESASLRTLTVNGQERRAAIHVPNRTAPEEGWPVVFLFHGAGGTGPHMERTAGFSRIADREGFLVIAPNAIAGNWALIGVSSPEAVQADLAFVQALLDEADRNHGINRDRVYAAGISRGGFFCSQLAFLAPRTFAAIAPVSSSLGASTPGLDPKLSAPMPVLLINGTADKLLPYEGGPLPERLARGLPGGSERCLLPVPEIARFWAEANGLTGEPQPYPVEDLRPDAGCGVSAVRYSTEKGPEVILMTLEGGGHAWPSPEGVLPPARQSSGPLCQDIDTASLIWEFFSRHQRAPNFPVAQKETPSKTATP